MLQVQRQVQQIDREIMEHRMNTQAEIQNDQYLNLMSLEEYINPLYRVGGNRHESVALPLGQRKW